MSISLDPRTEQNIATLHPVAAAKAREFMRLVLPIMAKKGVLVKIISGLRSWKEQDALYAKGRTASGRIVTNARGGYSNHNFGIAWDIGLFRGTEYLGTNPLELECGPIGESLGIEWGGRWKSFQDVPHYQVRPEWAKTMRESVMLAEMRARVAAKRDIFA